MKAAAQEPGMKAKEGKPRAHLVNFTFVMHMAKVLTKPVLEGKYSEFAWQQLDSAQVRMKYFSSLMRHATAAHEEGEYLDECGEPHWASVAVNAMILWWHQRKEQRNGKGKQGPASW